MLSKFNQTNTCTKNPTEYERIRFSYGNFFKCGNGHNFKVFLESTKGEPGLIGWLDCFA